MSRRKTLESIRKKLVTLSVKRTLVSEEFREIQANIHFSEEGVNCRVILVTSPSVGEGKTTIASNLAISMALQGEKILLIDANLYKPTIHTLFKIRNTVGLTDLLMGETTLSQSVYPNWLETLGVLTSGGSVPKAGLLGSDVMDKILQEATEQYDKVIIDSASILEATDTKLLAHMCDGVLLVIQKDRTSIEDATHARKMLEMAKATIIGGVLNK
jgi:capsular exopolysaccharide synthesis family protein